MDRVNNWLHCFLWIGLLIFLVSPFWADSRSNVTTSFYVGFLLPTVLITILKFRDLKALYRTLTFKIFLVFATWVTLSIAWSGAESSLVSLVKRPIYVTSLFVGVFFLLRWSEENFKLLLKIAAMTATLWMIYWLVKFSISGGTIAARFNGYGPSVNPIHFSQILGFFFIYWLVSWWQNPRKIAWLELTGMAVFIIALAYANSRSPFLGISLAILLIAGIKRDIKVILVLLALALLALVFFVHPEVRILEPNTSYRFDVWREVIKLMDGAFLIGRGYETGIEFLLPKLNTVFTDTHSIHVGVFYELGLIGLLIWIALYASLMLDFLRSEKTFLVLLSGCLVVFGFGSGMTDGMGYLSRPREHWFILWIPMAMLFALTTKSQNMSPLGRHIG
jgi:hypothetical protein